MESQLYDPDYLDFQPRRPWSVCYLIIKTGYDMTREVRVLSTRLWVGVMGHERTQTRDQGGVGAVGHERTRARDWERDKRTRADARDESGMGCGSVKR